MAWNVPKKPAEEIKPAESKKTEIVPARQNNGSMSLVEAPAGTDIMSDPQPVDQEDQVTPRLKLLQPLTPEVAAGMGKPGEIINSMSGANYGTEINFLPIMFWKMAIKWHPRTEGGGIADMCDNLMDNSPVSRNGEDMSKIDWGAEITKSNDKSGKLGDYWTKIYNYLVIINDEALPVVLTMARTKIRAAKKLIGYWQALLDKKTMKNYVWHARAYKLKSVEETKDNYKYFNYDIQPLGWSKEICPDRYVMAGKILNAFQGKTIKIDPEDVAGETEPEKA